MAWGRAKRERTVDTTTIPVCQPSPNGVCKPMCVPAGGPLPLERAGPGGVSPRAGVVPASLTSLVGGWSSFDVRTGLGMALVSCCGLQLASCGRINVAKAAQAMRHNRLRTQALAKFLWPIRTPPQPCRWRPLPCAGGRWPTCTCAGSRRSPLPPGRRRRRRAPAAQEAAWAFRAAPLTVLPPSARPGLRRCSSTTTSS